jgi:hypothetical protein
MSASLLVMVQGFGATSRHTRQCETGKNMMNLRLDPWVGVGVNARNRIGASVCPAVADVLSTSPETGTASGMSRQCSRLLGTQIEGRSQGDKKSCVELLAV